MATQSTVGCNLEASEQNGGSVLIENSAEGSENVPSSFGSAGLRPAPAQATGRPSNAR